MSTLEWATVAYVVGAIVLIGLSIWHGAQRYNAGFADGRTVGYAEGVKIGRRVAALPKRAGHEHVWSDEPVHKDGSKWDSYLCSCGQKRTVPHGIAP